MNYEKLEMAIKIFDKENVGKRFKILAAFIIVMLFIKMCIVLFHDDIHWIEGASLSLSFVFGMWLLMDTDLLQDNEYYFNCLLFAILITGVGFFIENRYPNINITATAFSMSGLIILLLQWPSRRIYLKLFNREPEFDIEGYEKFSNAIYSMILCFGGLILPILIMEYIKSMQI